MAHVSGSLRVYSESGFDVKFMKVAGLTRFYFIVKLILDPCRRTYKERLQLHLRNRFTLAYQVRYAIMYVFPALCCDHAYLLKCREWFN